MQEVIKKLCLECKEPLRGRADKKFCNDFCRNAYNNRQNTDQNNFMRQVNAILRRNRRLMEGHIRPGEELGKVPRQRLLGEGFDFRYHTHQYANKKGQIYTFCYDYGYLPLENDWLLIVRRLGRQEGQKEENSKDWSN